MCMCLDDLYLHNMLGNCAYEQKHMGVQLIGVAPINDSICKTVLMGLTKQFEGQ